MEIRSTPKNRSVEFRSLEDVANPKNGFKKMLLFLKIFEATEKFPADQVENDD